MACTARFRSGSTKGSSTTAASFATISSAFQSPCSPTMSAFSRRRSSSSSTAPSPSPWTSLCLLSTEPEGLCSRAAWRGRRTLPDSGPSQRKGQRLPAWGRRGGSRAGWFDPKGQPPPSRVGSLAPKGQWLPSWVKRRRPRVGRLDPRGQSLPFRVERLAPKGQSLPSRVQWLAPRGQRLPSWVRRGRPGSGWPDPQGQSLPFRVRRLDSKGQCLPSWVEILPSSPLPCAALGEASATLPA